MTIPDASPLGSILESVRFEGWFPISEVVNAPTSGIHEVFGEVGTYLVARFASTPPASVDRTCVEIIYIGEAHGRTRSTRARIVEFAKSAGLFAPPRAGSYAAWEFGNYFPVDAGCVFVAACPISSLRLPRAVRGVAPVLVENLVLTEYALRHKRLPILTNSGRPPTTPTFPSEATDELPAVFDIDDPAPVATRVVAFLAKNYGYSAQRRTYTWTEDGYTGVARVLGGGWEISMGWTTAPRRVGMWIYRDDEVWFGNSPEEEPVESAELLHALTERQWNRWWSEDYTIPSAPVG